MLYQLARLLALLADLQKSRTAITMKALCEEGAQHRSPLMVIRCDVERNLPHTLSVAQKIHEAGIHCTMYFHTRRDCYDPSTFASVRDLGHEVGYHHECLDRCHGDFEAARQLFLREVERFRQDGFPLTTVCGHGEGGLPKRGYTQNWDLFDRYPDLLESAGLCADVFATIIPRWKPIYASDTFVSYRRFWDRISSARPKPDLLMVAIHPHRWHDAFPVSLWEIGRDVTQRYANKIRKARPYHTIWE